MNGGWIAFGIIVITLGLMTYPILQLIPNDRQKKQLALRQAAMKLGFQIQIRHPHLDERLDALYEDLKKTVAYSLPQETGLEGTFTAIRSVTYEGQWFWLNEKFPDLSSFDKFLETTPKLPKQVLAVEFTQPAITFFIKEDSYVKTEEIKSLSILFFTSHK